MPKKFDDPPEPHRLGTVSTGTNVLQNAENIQEVPHAEELGIADRTARTAARYEAIQKCIASMVHACRCSDAGCTDVSCYKMKRVVQHARNCKKRVNGTCLVCKQLIAVFSLHAKSCTLDRCNVPFCMCIRQKLAENHRAQHGEALPAPTDGSNSDMVLRWTTEVLGHQAEGAPSTSGTTSDGAPTSPVNEEA